MSTIPKSPRSGLPCQEVSRKLELLANDDDSVDAALLRLEENGYLSDARFIEYFIRTRINKGHGPMRIQQDLRKKGVDSETSSLALEEADPDWYSMAENIRQKKFGNEPPLDAKDKARQIRFLQYRGFPVGVVMELF